MRAPSCRRYPAGPSRPWKRSLVPQRTPYTTSHASRTLVTRDVTTVSTVRDARRPEGRPATRRETPGHCGGTQTQTNKKHSEAALHINDTSNYKRPRKIVLL